MFLHNVHIKFLFMLNRNAQVVSLPMLAYVIDNTVTCSRAVLCC